MLRALRWLGGVLLLSLCMTPVVAQDESVDGVVASETAAAPWGRC